MMGSKLGKWLVIGTLVAAIVVAGVASVGVAGVAAQALGPGDGGFFRGMMGRWGGRDRGFLADELGLTVEELEAAQQAAQEAALAQAVEDGDLSQEEADLLSAHRALRGYLDMRTLMAEVLGISPEQLGEQPAHAWIEEQGLDFETFHEQMQAAREDAIADAVADGIITQAQADALLEGDWGPMMQGRLRGGVGPGVQRGFQGGGLRGSMRGNRGALRNSGNCPMFGGDDA
jgi:hypothetical protein